MTGCPKLETPVLLELGSETESTELEKTSEIFESNPRPKVVGWD